MLSVETHATSFQIWSQVLHAKQFHDRSLSEKRALFHAMAVSVGEEAVPYYRGILLRRAWRNRKVHRDAAVIAAEALGKIGTPAAVSALEAGRRRLNRAVRRACLEALEIMPKSAP
jgi:HEAT repeat protein